MSKNHQFSIQSRNHVNDSKNVANDFNGKRMSTDLSFEENKQQIKLAMQPSAMLMENTNPSCTPKTVPSNTKIDLLLLQRILDLAVEICNKQGCELIKDSSGLSIHEKYNGIKPLLISKIMKKAIKGSNKDILDALFDHPNYNKLTIYDLAYVINAAIKSNDSALIRRLVDHNSYEDLADVSLQAVIIQSIKCKHNSFFDFLNHKNYKDLSGEVFISMLMESIHNNAFAIEAFTSDARYMRIDPSSFLSVIKSSISKNKLMFNSFIDNLAYENMSAEDLIDAIIWGIKKEVNVIDDLAYHPNYRNLKYTDIKNLLNTSIEHSGFGINSLMNSVDLSVLSDQDLNVLIRSVEKHKSLNYALISLKQELLYRNCATNKKITEDDLEIDEQNSGYNELSSRLVENEEQMSLKQKPLHLNKHSFSDLEDISTNCLGSSAKGASVHNSKNDLDQAIKEVNEELSCDDSGSEYREKIGCELVACMTHKISIKHFLISTRDARDVNHELQNHVKTNIEYHDAHQVMFTGAEETIQCSCGFNL